MIHMRFYIDPETGYPHIYGHGVSEWEVEEVLSDKDEDRASRDGAREAFGRARSGRRLCVVYKPGENRNSVFVITAYPLTGRARSAHRRRRRRRRR